MSDDVDCVEDELTCDCDGDGWLVGDCFEDTCCCADPELEHDLVPCICNAQIAPAVVCTQKTTSINAPGSTIEEGRDG